MGGLTRVIDDLVNSDAIPPHGDFYVTATSGNRVLPLLGPYEDIRGALGGVSRGRELLVHERGSEAHWYAYGVSRCPIGSEIKVAFDLQSAE